MKTSVLFMAGLISIVISAVACLATPQENPSLASVDCGHWITYEKDLVDYLAQSMESLGIPLDDTEIEGVEIEAHASRTAYIMGLMDAYNSIASGEDTALKFAVWQYSDELDRYCSQEANSGEYVARAIAVVNILLKNKQP